LEPPHLAILEPKSSASTNSATPAEKSHSLEIIAKMQVLYRATAQIYAISEYGAIRLPRYENERDE
ncbi:MAG TPA: hypothetical protein PK071_05145, partial [Atopobiaceae bacterium]|nr:hypothetical protein [Atopobiaceae bacterium]